MGVLWNQDVVLFAWLGIGEFMFSFFEIFLKWKFLEVLRENWYSNDWLLCLLLEIL